MSGLQRPSHLTASGPVLITVISVVGRPFVHVSTQHGCRGAALSVDHFVIKPLEAEPHIAEPDRAILKVSPRETQHPRHRTVRFKIAVGVVYMLLSEPIQGRAFRFISASVALADVWAPGQGFQAHLDSLEPISRSVAALCLDALPHFTGSSKRKT